MPTKFYSDLTRNGSAIKTNGVTLNCPLAPFGSANGGYGSVTYPIMKWQEQACISNKLYLTNASLQIRVPDTEQTFVLNTRMFLETRLHELTHAVTLETPGTDLLTVESIACMLECDLFRLMGYNEEFYETFWNDMNIFREYVFDNGNYSNVAVQFANSDPHIWPGGWIPAFIYHDFVGYAEYEQGIIDYYSRLHAPYTHIDLVPDKSWQFIKNYYFYAGNIPPPSQYNKDEQRLYYFELASNESLKQTFLTWGFNVSSYTQLPAPTPTPSPSATPSPTPQSIPEPTTTPTLTTSPPPSSISATKPTIAPTNAPTIKPTVDPTSHPTPIVPEYPAFVAISLFIAVGALTFLISKKERKSRQLIASFEYHNQINVSSSKNLGV